MATAVPPAPAELDIHKQRGDAGPSRLVSLQSVISTASSAAGAKVKRKCNIPFVSKEGRGECPVYKVKG